MDDQALQTRTLTGDIRLSVWEKPLKDVSYIYKVTKAMHMSL